MPFFSVLHFIAAAATTTIIIPTAAAAATRGWRWRSSGFLPHSLRRQVPGRSQGAVREVYRCAGSQRRAEIYHLENRKGKMGPRPQEEEGARRDEGRERRGTRETRDKSRHLRKYPNKCCGTAISDAAVVVTNVSCVAVTSISGRQSTYFIHLSVYSARGRISGRYTGGGSKHMSYFFFLLVRSKTQKRSVLSRAETPLPPREQQKQPCVVTPLSIMTTFPATGNGKSKYKK